jgi:hypothetical protein
MIIFPVVLLADRKSKWIRDRYQEIPFSPQYRAYSETREGVSGKHKTQQDTVTQVSWLARHSHSGHVNRFEIFGVDLKRYTAHNRVQREDDAKFVLLPGQYSLKTLHDSSLDSHSFAHPEVCMRFDLAQLRCRT